MDREKFSFLLPAKGEYMTVVRLTSSAIANKAGLSIDKIEDLKLCVSEICNIAIKSGTNDVFNIEYLLGKEDIEISFLNINKPNKEIENFEISKMILKALIDDITFEDNLIKFKFSV